MTYRATNYWSSQINLKEGEKHCPKCDGYGVLPIEYNQHLTVFRPPKCDYCNGVAKILPKRQKKT